MNKQALIITGVLALGLAGVLGILRAGPGEATAHHDDHEHEDVHTEVDAPEATHRPNGDQLSREPHAEITADAARAAGIVTSLAGPALIRDTLLLYGSIIPDERRVRAVGARFPGIAREVRRNLGERVAANETLALVESNESLQTYPVRSPIGGVIISRAINPGENVGSEPIFQVADLSTVIAELAAFRRDLPKLRVGQQVNVRADGDGTSGRGPVTFISPIGSGESQSVKLRVSLDNRDGHWQPGIFVTGEVEVTAAEVPVAVVRSAVQTFDGDEVVFINFGELYEPRRIDIGTMDREHVEIRGGLTAGDIYVAENSFLIKADIGKSIAGHEH